MSTENGKPKSGTVKSARRREELRRAIPKPTLDLKSMFMRRDLVNTMLVFCLFFIAAGLLTVLSHQNPKIAAEQVMKDTRLKRVDFEVTNVELTEKERSDARDRAPRVYKQNSAYINGLRDALLGLPVAVENKALEEIATELVSAFDLNVDTNLEAVQQHVSEGKISKEWEDWIVTDFVENTIPYHPAIDSTEWQIEFTRSKAPEFSTTGRPRRIQIAQCIELNLESINDYKKSWSVALQDSKIPKQIASLIAARISSLNSQATYTFDPVATRARAEEEAAKVLDITIQHHAGDAIYKTGDTLTTEQLALVEREEKEYREKAPAMALLYSKLGTFGVVALISIFIAGYLIRFYPRVVHNPYRVAAIASLSVGMLAICVWIAITAPPFIFFVTIATMLFAAMVLVIAYDQRMASTIVGLLCALTTFALDQSIGFFVLLLATCAAAIAVLPEVRHRNALIRAAAFSASIAGTGALLLGVYEFPLIDGNMETIQGVWRQIAGHSGLSVAACLGVGFLLLGILPSIERLFDMTTGMTLVELRDPRQPLLRQLQERAPGTYNHSLQVASIAEAAADAIGANSLLTYVGALYHDIGKMNKPDYFVENQSDGPNKHAKLSPAMSLLVIVGHVKDGVELAKEYNIPKTLLHFIESHHGTTLVEYFYHAAKSRAEQEGETVKEVEFRYPGPKPKTKEAAILMLSDATESATRAMDDPGPASIENLVRKLARKRLIDGQFDECDLTLKELTAIEDSIVKSVWALYHGRISYPSGEEDEDKTNRQDDSVVEKGDKKLHTTEAKRSTA